ncbi:MAG: hypothetical protein JWP45_2941 [Mucilaginibacter sp.]|nr:hypothetical protein [Mucilaginibacter sp.]
MEKELMDIGVLAEYTGFWKWQIKQHLKPEVFKKLPANKLKKYATVFNVDADAFKNMTVHGA